MKPDRYERDHSCHFECPCQTEARPKHDAACLARRTTPQNRLVCSCGMTDAEVLAVSRKEATT